MGTMTQPTNDSMTCKGCGRDLPLSAFKLTRWGTHAKICNDCVAEKRTETRYNHTQMGGGTAPFSDLDFDGRTIGDVWRLMCRAEKWLESRGCVITLDGEFREVKVRKLKKE